MTDLAPRGSAAYQGGDEFWIYEDWSTGPHSARLHKGECFCCKHGRGLAGGTRKEDAAWRGPLLLGELEHGFLGKGGKYLTPMPCKHCLPEYSGR